MAKRILSIFLALVLAGFSGCGQQESPGPVATAAKGRYVETEIALPMDGSPQDMVTLSDGRLRVGLNTTEGEPHVFTREGDTWQEDVQLPQSLPGLGKLDMLRLSPDGSVFLSLVKGLGDGTYEYHLVLLSPSGELRELPVDYPEANEKDGFLLGGADFTDSGKLMVLFSFDDLREVDPDTGALSENLNELGIWANMGGICAGEDTYLLSSDLCARLREGQQEKLTDVLGEQLTASAKTEEGSRGKNVLWQNSQGYLFFTTGEGLYSFVPGGSVTEELVSANKSSFGDPSFLPRALTGTEDGSFYVLGMLGGEAVLCQYDFDANAPLQATQVLKLYSLYDDEDLRQIISRYQKSHPETDIHLEIGLSGEDGVTEADALRTLNTEILGGSGPDILRLDGMSLDSYLEKDLFLDLSDLLEETKTLENITKCYETKGKVSVLPVAFAIPAIYGPKDLVDSIHNLDSFVEAATQALARSGADSLMNGMIPVLVTDNIYDSCSAAWKTDDGTLDPSALEAFLAASKALYDLDAPLRERYADILGQMDGDLGITPGEFTAIGGSWDILMNGEAMSVGTLESMDVWSYALAGDQQLEGYTLAPLTLQASGVFLPRQIYGVLNTTEIADTAKDFIRFLLGEEVQKRNLNYGFPVNQAVFEALIQEDKATDVSFATSTEDGQMLSLTARYPSAQERKELAQWVRDLTTPALTDRTIRTLITAQAADCMNGTCTAKEAADRALQSLNLYLSE